MPEEKTVSDEIRPENCRFRPWWFFGALLGSAIISLITTPLILLNGGGNSLLIGMAAMLAVASVAAGVFGGIHFTRAQQPLPPDVRIAVGIISVIGCIGVAFPLAFGGCILSIVLIYATS